MFDEGKRHDFEVETYGKDLGLHKDLVSQNLTFEAAWYVIKDKPEHRHQVFVNRDDLFNFYGRPPTDEELKKFQLGPDGNAITGGGVSTRDGMYSFHQTAISDADGDKWRRFMADVKSS